MDKHLSFIHGYYKFISYNNTNTLKKLQQLRRIKMCFNRTSNLYPKTNFLGYQLQICGLFRQKKRFPDNIF